MRTRSALRPAQLRVIEELNGISVETLRALLAYDPATGAFTWRARPDNLSFTTRWAGKAAFTAYNGHGYKTAIIMSRRVMAHRAAFAIYYGRAPQGEIDHINGVRDDNRIENLREVSSALNKRNAAKSRRNTSGVTGVSWKKAYGKWQACFAVQRRQIHLGYFTEKQDAIDALLAARSHYGFHENHGREPNAEA